MSNQLDALIQYQAKKKNAAIIWIVFIFTGFSYGFLGEGKKQAFFYFTFGMFGILYFGRFFTLSKAIKDYNLKVAESEGLNTDSLFMVGLIDAAEKQARSSYFDYSNQYSVDTAYSTENQNTATSGHITPTIEVEPEVIEAKKQRQEVYEVYLVPFSGIYKGFYKFGVTKHDVYKRYQTDDGFGNHANKNEIKSVKVRSKNEAYRLEGIIKRRMSNFIDNKVRILFETKATEIMKLDSFESRNEFNTLVNELDLGTFFLENELEVIAKPIANNVAEPIPVYSFG